MSQESFKLSMFVKVNEKTEKKKNKINKQHAVTWKTNLENLDAKGWRMRRKGFLAGYSSTYIYIVCPYVKH